MISHNGNSSGSSCGNVFSITSIDVMMMATFSSIHLVKATWSGSCLHGIAAFPGAPHDILELLVHSNKGLSFMRQLALDVRRRKDGLQVHPVLLTGQPLIQGIAEQVQLPFYPLNLILHTTNKPEHNSIHVSTISWVEESAVVIKTSDTCMASYLLTWSLEA